MSATFELEGFEPISRLGGGGFGDVWLARQTNVDRQVAIKVGHSAIQDETIRLRFDRECKALGRLSGHPNIVDVYTAGSLSDGRPYLVLEYISGGTLWQRLKKSPIPEQDLRSIGSQLAAALTEAHSSGVLHRDLKPENILIRSTGEAVLGDFGIARLHDGANTTSAAITASVAYAAPEILSGKRATVASDLYGVGVCLLAAVFRSVPFVQKTDESIHPIINRVLSDNPPDVRRHAISDDLAVIIDGLLAKNPSDRPASAAELLARFQALAPLPAAGSADASATQVVAAPAGTANPAAPAAPLAPPGRRAARPPAGPRPQDAAPGRHDAGAQPAWGTAQNAAPGQTPFPIPPPYDDGGPRSDHLHAGQAIKGPSSNLRLFALAYAATLILGGIALFLVLRMLGNDEEADPATNDGSQPTVEPIQTVQDAVAAEDPPPGSSSQSEELTIPLGIADTTFSEDAEATDESPGPGAGTLCDNNPDTTGLLEWKGQVISTDLGLRSLYQVISRFETAEQASDYLDAYAATNDCETWLVETEDENATEVLYAALQTPPPSFGDQSRQFDITGEYNSTISIHGRVLLVQSGTDVLTLSITALSEDHVAELDNLAPVALERLGYTS